MEFEELKRSIVEIGGPAATAWRSDFIAQYVDTSKKYFAERIATTRHYSDGDYYTGYLWDCLKSYERISFDVLTQKVEELASIRVFWDLHSAEKIHTKDYFRFGRDVVLEMTPSVFVAGLRYLPEDLYLSDSPGHRALILTHETDVSNERICLACGSW